jgi:PPOX class probable F420-dependent enzyme
VIATLPGAPAPGKVLPVDPRTRLAQARSAVLATSAEDRPHLVPVTFALSGDRIAIAVDHKPKTTTNLKRLRNIRANPRVSILADHYDDDWTRLWWARADGVAVILTVGHDEPLSWLRAKYTQYRTTPPTGPVILVEVDTWRGWSYIPDTAGTPL